MVQMHGGFEESISKEDGIGNSLGCKRKSFEWRKKP
jgi:hypothetical protein